nr:ABC transporter ATP-binding protein [uncultured Duganella sp.]
MLDYSNLSIRLGERDVLAGFDLRLQAGERVGMLGASGAGKSSVLKLAAGLLKPSAGTLRQTFRHPVLVFQEPRLLPWCSMLDNVTLPLEAAGARRDEARMTALSWLERVGLRDQAACWPRELSGGMAQRVALARAFALQPDLLLLDEPFSALDPGLRRALTQLCDACLRDSCAALLYVSHHPHELVELVDRCVLLENGKGRDYLIGAHAQRAQVADALHRALTEPKRKQS